MNRPQKRPHNDHNVHSEDHLDRDMEVGIGNSGRSDIAVTIGRNLFATKSKTIASDYARSIAMNNRISFALIFDEKCKTTELLIDCIIMRLLFHLFSSVR